MTTTFFVFLWILFIIVVLAVITRILVHKKYSYLFMDWEKVDMPYITIDIQGNKFNMIVDSGASLSIIRKDAVDMLSSYEYIPRVVNLSAITDDSVRSNVISVPINIGDKEVKTDFVIYGGDDIAGFGSKCGVTIHGILGVEFFKKTKGKIDFNTQSVIFP